MLHASRLRKAGVEGQIAVVFEEARPAEIAPLIVDAYGLTRREGEITQLILRGLSTAEVSEQLHITPNTVRDHFKSIFDKVGVRSRRELVGQVFAQQYQPRMATGQSPGPYGWFTRGVRKGQFAERVNLFASSQHLSYEKADKLKC